MRSQSDSILRKRGFGFQLLFQFSLSILIFILGGSYSSDLREAAKAESEKSNSSRGISAVDHDESNPIQLPEREPNHDETDVKVRKHRKAADDTEFHSAPQFYNGLSWAKPEPNDSYVKRRNSETTVASVHNPVTESSSNVEYTSYSSIVRRRYFNDQGNPWVAHTKHKTTAVAYYEAQSQEKMSGLQAPGTTAPTPYTNTDSNNTTVKPSDANSSTNNNSKSIKSPSNTPTPETATGSDSDRDPSSFENGYLTANDPDSSIVYNSPSSNRKINSIDDPNRKSTKLFKSKQLTGRSKSISDDSSNLDKFPPSSSESIVIKHRKSASGNSYDRVSVYSTKKRFNVSLITDNERDIYPSFSSYPHRPLANLTCYTINSVAVRKRALYHYYRRAPDSCPLDYPCRDFNSCTFWTSGLVGQGLKIQRRVCQAYFEDIFEGLHPDKVQYIKASFSNCVDRYTLGVSLQKFRRATKTRNEGVRKQDNNIELMSCEARIEHLRECIMIGQLKGICLESNSRF